MDYAKLREIVTKHGGQIEGGINWTWATFPNDQQGNAAFDECLKAFPEMDHRGYYEAQLESSNPNLHQGGFRFR